MNSTHQYHIPMNVITATVTVILMMLTTSFAGVQRLQLTENVLQLKKIHPDTSSGENSCRPKLSDQNKDDQLVAKIDAFGVDRYYTFETDEDINDLILAVQQGWGARVSWYKALNLIHIT